MTELRWGNSGGRLSARDEEDFVGGAVVVVRRGFLLGCGHYGSEHARGYELALPQTRDIDVQQAVRTVDDGATVIGVSLNLGDLD